MKPYRVALSGDFIKADGSPAYPMFDLSPLKQANIETAFLQCSDEIDADEIADYDALILLGHRFTKNSIPTNQRLATVARFGVGYDTVDVEACTKLDIAVIITPDGVRRPVAVSVISFMLALTGKLLIKDRLTREGTAGWNKRSNYMGTGVTGKTLGILGFGNIGAEIVTLAKAFDMTFIAADPFADATTLASLGVELVSTEELFKRSDVLSVNCLLNDDTFHIVNEQNLALMKPTSYLINTSRGPVVDEQALIKVLQVGGIAGAGLDVFEEEPVAENNELLTLENVIVAPHSLCWTDECFAGIGAAAIKAVLAVMQGEQPRVMVNREVMDNAAWLEKLSNYKSRYGH